MASGSRSASPTDSRHHISVSKVVPKGFHDHRPSPGSDSSVEYDHEPQSQSKGDASRSFAGKGNFRRQVSLYKRCIVTEGGGEEEDSVLVRQVTIDRLPAEGERVQDDEMLNRQHSVQGPHKTVLQCLLRPKDWKPPDPDEPFFLSLRDIQLICDMVTDVLAEEETVVRLKAPVKVFGDIHGQFTDLMRIFEQYGCPNREGDITYIDYLFLGDYVDRGRYSLEVILLLFALKIEFPSHIHLLRGNHESPDINDSYGFKQECMSRVGVVEGRAAWESFNSAFAWLPLCAVIDRRVMCMHGGIGSKLQYISQVDQLERPLDVVPGLVQELLWSDPTQHDSINGIHPNERRGEGIVMFGPDRVKEFCDNNNLQLIIRAHECVMDGFERFASGHLITLFSATNYCNVFSNAGAILVIGRELDIVPKLIYPGKGGRRNSSSDKGEADNRWLQSDQRPATPPRDLERHNVGGRGETPNQPFRLQPEEKEEEQLSAEAEARRARRLKKRLKQLQLREDMKAKAPGHSDSDEADVPAPAPAPAPGVPKVEAFPEDVTEPVDDVVLQEMKRLEKEKRREARRRARREAERALALLEEQSDADHHSEKEREREREREEKKSSKRERRRLKEETDFVDGAEERESRRRHKGRSSEQIDPEDEADTELSRARLARKSRSRSSSRSRTEE